MPEPKAETKVLLLGSEGQLGQTLLQVCGLGLGKGQGLDAGYTLTAWSRQQVDICDEPALWAMLDQLQPDLLINAAAYTAVDAAEQHSAEAYAVNATAVTSLARWTVANAAWLLHLSTDFVFAGDCNRPYTPQDPTGPLGVYGQSKLAGEQALTSLAPAHSCIIRTSWLYSPYGRNFVKTMLQLMRQRDSLKVVADQLGTPCSTFSLSRCILAALHHRPTGIYHWSDAGSASWHEFALAIQQQAMALGLLKRTIPIHPIPASEYPTPARRPAYSVLDKHDTTATLGCTPRPWSSELHEVLTQMRDLESGAATHSDTLRG
ncbi:MAG: dTDP-4-dehydrorhamnose reductase [Pseudomonadales bacterium]|nr:dTDP-4-dehydrorhamnose reductase [Pseudomonadales bacterium]